MEKWLSMNQQLKHSSNNAPKVTRLADDRAVWCECGSDTRPWLLATTTTLWHGRASRARPVGRELRCRCKTHTSPKTACENGTWDTSLQLGYDGINIILFLKFLSPASFYILIMATRKFKFTCGLQYIYWTARFRSHRISSNTKSTKFWITNTIMLQILSHVNSCFNTKFV